MNDGDGPVLVFEQIGTDRNILHEDYYELLLREENDEHVSKKWAIKGGKGAVGRA